METINKKLRLLVTTYCPNNCPLCCNKGWDFSKLPVVDRWDYEEVMITGGEPLTFIPDIVFLIEDIRAIQYAMGVNSKIYVYTAIADKGNFFPALEVADGIVYTPHSKEDVKKFINLNHILLQDPRWSANKSLRLNLFPNIKAMLPEGTDLSKWQVKDIEWIENCPVPKGEDFRRINKLWEL